MPARQKITLAEMRASGVRDILGLTRLVLLTIISLLSLSFFVACVGSVQTE
jgi:hypothetical protein